MIITKPRGTQDIIYETDPGFDVFVQAASMVAKLNGYYQIKTPIFEHKELFIRSVGETSDIVNKEFYDFKDKGGRDLCLRPELTAGVCRCVVENKLLNKMPLPIKFFYVEPMFRYERPQSGRLRMFHQFGVECIGTNSYYDDVDMILLATSILDAFQYRDYIIKINNICSSATRAKWIKALKEYFLPFKDQLTEDSINRLEKNPLRILDDKVDGKKEFVKNAPKCTQFATQEEKDYFANITKALDELHINYVIDETLVRGLDYYCNFIFEIESTSKDLIGQPTICGGGRYNQLTKELGGDDSNCVGFAIGIERILVALANNEVLQREIANYKHVDVAIANLAKETEMITTVVSQMLRIAGFSCTTNRNTYKIDKQFKYAQNAHAKYVMIIGPKEIQKQVVLIKDQRSMLQDEVPVADIINYLKKKEGR